MDTRPVAIVAQARETRDLAPWDNLDIAIWSLNRSWRDWQKFDDPASGSYLKRTDRHFELHPLWFLEKGLDAEDKRAKWPHWDWLTQKHPFPIYMQEAYPFFPSSVRFPIEELVGQIGRVFTSTPAYMIGLAILERRPSIALYGVEMESGSEYEYQQPATSYLVGLARGLGIPVTVHKDSSYMKWQLYGYEEMVNPALSAMEGRLRYFEEVEKMIYGQACESRGGKKILNAFKKAFKKTHPEWSKDPAVVKEMKRLDDEFRQTEAQLNTVGGGKGEIKRTLRLLRAPLPIAFQQEVHDEPKG